MQSISWPRSALQMRPKSRPRNGPATMVKILRRTPQKIASKRMIETMQDACRQESQTKSFDIRQRRRDTIIASRCRRSRADKRCYSCKHSMWPGRPDMHDPVPPRQDCLDVHNRTPRRSVDVEAVCRSEPRELLFSCGVRRVSKTNNAKHAVLQSLLTHLAALQESAQASFRWLPKRR